jgi:hypothetical protein
MPLAGDPAGIGGGNSHHADTPIGGRSPQQLVAQRINP